MVYFNFDLSCKGETPEDGRKNKETNSKDDFIPALQSQEISCAHRSEFSLVSRVTSAFIAKTKVKIEKVGANKTLTVILLYIFLSNLFHPTSQVYTVLGDQSLCLSL